MSKNLDDKSPEQLREMLKQVRAQSAAAAKRCGKEREEAIWAGEDVSAFPEPMSLAELELALTQPLLDLGWRVDYDRKGISRPGHFLALDEMKAIAQAGEEQLRGLSVQGLDNAIFVLDPDWTPE